MIEDSLLTYLRTRQDRMVEDLMVLVEHETPSSDKEALDRMAHYLAERFRLLDATVRLEPNLHHGDHVIVEMPAGADADPTPGLILCHFDTVWPRGTLAERPFRVSDGRAYGPGIFDMKASLVLAEYALRSLQELGQALPRPVTLLFTSDEEVGSPSSRALIEALARRSTYALVLEAPLPGGRIKTARKGVGRFVLSVEGRAAHAGVEPERGVSAVVELAHQILRVQALAQPDHGSTINVGLVEGGTAPNVVPARATATLDVRVSTLAEAQRIETGLHSLAPNHPEARLTVTGAFSRPPMERTPAIAELLERARVLARRLGQELEEGATGGASDGNFTAALGLPTLDGLGVLGAGAHAEHEHILTDSLPERAALLALLLASL